MANKWDVFKVSSDLAYTKSMCPSDLKIDKDGFIKVPPYSCLLRDIFDQFRKKKDISFNQVTRIEYEVATHKHNFREIHCSGSHSYTKATPLFSGKRILWCNKCGAIRHETIIDDLVMDERIYLPEGD